MLGGMLLLERVREVRTTEEAKPMARAQLAWLTTTAQFCFLW
jgi:hypothetical protein